MYQALYTKASKAELNSDYDTAFRLYLDSAKAFLHLSRSTASHVDEKAKSAWKADAAKALERAEAIKKVKSEYIRPVVRDVFSERKGFYLHLFTSNFTTRVWLNGLDRAELMVH